MLYEGRETRCLILILILLATAGWGKTEESFQDLMDKARDAQLAGKLDEAAELYGAALRLRPHSGPAEYSLGLIASIQKKYAEAVDLLSQALRDDPSLIPAHLFLGIAYFNLQKPDQALPPLEQFYRQWPNDREVRFFLAGTYNALGNYPKAAEYYAAQLELTPERTEVWFYLGQCLLNMPRRMKTRLLKEQREGYLLMLLDAQGQAEKGDVPVAERYFLEAIKTDPANSEGYVNLANLFLREGKYAEAKVQFQQALERSPHNCRALEGLGDVDLALGDIPASIAQYARVASAKQACIEESVPVNLGLSLTEFGARLKSLSEFAAPPKWKQAVAFQLSRLNGPAEERVAQSQPCQVAMARPEWLSSPGWNLFSANRLENRGELRCAIKTLSAAENESDGDLETVYWIFRIYMRIAQRVFLELANRAPDSYLLSEVRAESLELQGRDSDAEEEYRKAITSSGSDPIPFIEFGRFKCKRNELDEAVEILKGALARAPYNARANDLMGEAHFMKGDHASAIPYLQTAIAGDPDNVDGRIRLAQSLAKLDRIEEAIRILEAAPTDDEGRVHYVLAGFYRREGKKEEMQRALAFFEARQKAIKAKVVEQATKELPASSKTKTD